MLRNSERILLAKPTAKSFELKERLDFKFSYEPFRYYLVIKAKYDIVLLFANNKVEVEAMKLIEGTVQLDLFIRLPTGQIGQLVQSYTDFAVGLRELSIKTGDIEPPFNCHGYCFGDSMYWINNNQVQRILQGDGYFESSGKDDVSVVVYSLGDEVAHTAKRYPSDGNFIYESKAGVRGLEQTTRIEDAARGLAYDSVRIFHPPELHNKKYS